MDTGELGQERVRTSESQTTGLPGPQEVGTYESQDTADSRSGLGQTYLGIKDNMTKRPTTAAGIREQSLVREQI
jgi:hypothetical protein